jgi:hypothetical protein
MMRLVRLSRLPVQAEGADPIGTQALLVLHGKSNPAVGLLPDLKEA